MPSALDLSLGALEVGIAISTVLYGVITVQTYIYACSEHNDGRLLRLLVLFVWILETLHAALLWVYIYTTTVTQRFASLDKVSWYLGTTVILGVCVGSATQAFFANRVRVISGRLSVALVGWTLALARLGFGFAAGVSSIRAPSFSEYNASARWLTITYFVVEILVDAWNTGSLCFYLATKRSEFASTRRIVNKIMFWAIETGFVTCVCAILTLIFVLARPVDLLWGSTLPFYPRFYAISLLVSLNGRGTLRRLANESSDYHSCLWDEPRSGSMISISVKKSIDVAMSPVTDGKKSPRTQLNNDEESQIGDNDSS